MSLALRFKLIRSSGTNLEALVFSKGDSLPALSSAIMAPRTSCFCAVLACRALRWDGPLCGASGRWPSPTSPVTPLQPHQRRRSLDERGVRVGQPVRQVVALQVHLPGRAVGLAAVAYAQVQHAVAGRGGFKRRHAVLAGPLHPFDLAFPGLPLDVQSHTGAGDYGGCRY